MTKITAHEFGETIRRLRMEREITLRKFAEMVGLSPTFISMLERGEFEPPSEENIRIIARALHQNEDEFVALAGRISEEWKAVIRENPREMADFLRTAKNLTKEDLSKLTKQAVRMSEKNQEEQ